MCGDYREFDATTDDNQFRHRLPKLPPEATNRERELAARYTRISFILISSDSHDLGYEPDATIVWLCVDGQQFRVTPECRGTNMSHSGPHISHSGKNSWFCSECYKKDQEIGRLRAKSDTVTRPVPNMEEYERMRRRCKVFEGGLIAHEERCVRLMEFCGHDVSDHYIGDCEDVVRNEIERLQKTIWIAHDELTTVIEAGGQVDDDNHPIAKVRAILRAAVEKDQP